MAPDPHWLALCRRAMAGVRDAFDAGGDRAVETGRGEGGDMALVIYRAAEEVVFAEQWAVGLPVTVVSEERGEVELAGGGATHVVVDPVDGSLNAKRGLPFACVSIAVAGGPRLDGEEVGVVAGLFPRREG